MQRENRVYLGKTILTPSRTLKRKPFISTRTSASDGTHNTVGTYSFPAGSFHMPDAPIPSQTGTTERRMQLARDRRDVDEMMERNDATDQPRNMIEISSIRRLNVKGRKKGLMKVFVAIAVVLVLTVGLSVGLVGIRESSGGYCGSKAHDAEIRGFLTPKIKELLPETALSIEDANCLVFLDHFWM